MFSRKPRKEKKSPRREKTGRSANFSLAGPLHPQTARRKSTTGVSALSSSLKVWQLWRPGGENDGADAPAPPEQCPIGICVCVCVYVACICIYIYNIYRVYLYLYIYTRDDADVSGSIHIYNICIGSRFLKILVQRRLPLRFETVAPTGGRRGLQNLPPPPP